MRLAILTTHPIQYYAPVFKLLQEANQIDIKVYYTWGREAFEKFDPGFGKKINWDIPLLQGYKYEWVKNTSKDPGSHHFRGVVNPELIDQLNAWQPNAILIYGWAYHSHLKAMRYYKNKIPVYFRGDSTLIDVKTGFKALLRSVFLKWVYSHIDHAFYVGTNNKAYFKKYGLKDSQLSFAPHAIDNKRFAEDRSGEAAALRQSLCIDTGEVMILFAGKLEDKKSPQSLLSAFLAMKLSNLHLVFAGNGILEKTLKDKAGKNKNVHFINFQNQSVMPALYQACDLFCLPSKGPGETWGLAVNEAMAAAKPVLVSNKCGCAVDLVIGGFTGEVFDTGNPADISLKLTNLIKDIEALKILGINAKNKIADWNFSDQINAMMKIIDKKSAN